MNKLQLYVEVVHKGTKLLISLNGSGNLLGNGNGIFYLVFVKNEFSFTQRMELVFQKEKGCMFIGYDITDEKANVHIVREHAKKAFDEKWVVEIAKKVVMDMTNARLYTTAYSEVITGICKTLQLSKYEIRNLDGLFDGELARHFPHIKSASTSLRYCSSSAISIVTIHSVALVKCFTALGVMETTENTHTNEFAEKAKRKLLDIIFGFDEEKLQKLASKYFGPYQVIKKIRKVAYKLLLPPTAKIHPVFHVSRLKKKVGSTVITSPDLPPMFESEKTKWYPSKIIDGGIFKKNNAAVTKWLVQWKNTNEEDATWEDPEQFMNRFPEFQTGIASLIFKRGGMLGHPSKSCDRAWPKPITVRDILHSYLVCDLCQL
ncbi:putative chromatin remodeling & transcriptional activation CHROMO-DOMAIN family [Rosa chinensis]|uniref:Putative chromatin remodeling & transcriptional activation CHROMO-DOMAIN family n=1 Tax=Rosa chinensis TaxID=74649 RepID=A0A2P6S6Y7_ROSCH|nr:putative chromatin remodeling & transcriptional activation CHROMO-DOMAIN family [Rosa chinensis]